VGFEKIEKLETVMFGTERMSMKVALRRLFGQGFYYSEREEAWRSATNPDRTIRHRVDRGKVRWILNDYKDITAELDAIMDPSVGLRHLEGASHD
jgi:hypothetical protein